MTTIISGILFLNLKNGREIAWFIEQMLAYHVQSSEFNPQVHP